MIQINFISKKELEAFKDGAQCQAAFIYDDLSENGFSDNGAFSKALEIYDNSSIHNIILKNSEILGANTNEYNREAIADVITSIAEMDADLYQTIIYFIHAALEQKDVNSRKEYFKTIKDIVDLEKNYEMKTNVDNCNEESIDDGEYPKEALTAEEEITTENE